MKITIVTLEYSIDGGGLAFQCRKFVEMLIKLGHQVSVITSLPENVTSGGYNPSLGIELALEEKLKLDSYKFICEDLIIAFGGGMNGYYAAQLAGRIKKRFWIMFRGSDANLAKWNLSSSEMNRMSCRQAELVICLSKEIKDNLISLGVSKDKTRIIPNMAAKIADVKCNFQKSKITIGSGATNLNEKKGVSRLIKMVAYYNRIHPKDPIYLELAGQVDDDYLKQFQTIAERENVINHIRFLGKVDRLTFINLQKCWDLYIQASVCEGMGNAVTDGMSIGKPVLISNTGYIAEMAEEFFPNMVFKSLDPVEMVNSLEYVLNSQHIELDYRRFYKIFFERVAPSFIENEWTDLLLYKKTTCSVITPARSILSVSLHDVTGGKHDNITTPVRVFEKFVNDICNFGYVLCSMAKYIEASETERSNLIVCTFDDGYEGLLLNAQPIMEKYGFSATVFVCTDYLGKTNSWNFKDKTIRKHMDVEQLRLLQAYGWEIGSHGITHESLLRLNDEELKNQLGNSKMILEALFGPVSSYAYPYGDYSPFIENQVKKYYKNAFLLMEGGVYLAVDAHRIHRYYISEIYEIISSK